MSWVRKMRNVAMTLLLSFLVELGLGIIFYKIGWLTYYLIAWSIIIIFSIIIFFLVTASDPLLVENKKEQLEKRGK